MYILIEEYYNSMDDYCSTSVLMGSKNLELLKQYAIDNINSSFSQSDEIISNDGEGLFSAEVRTEGDFGETLIFSYTIKEVEVLK